MTDEVLFAGGIGWSPDRAGDEFLERFNKLFPDKGL